jgi:glyoxylase-like metal-dependent hydrolase (beta-lactamase superfamily II)
MVSKAEVEYAARVSLGDAEDHAIPDNWEELLDRHSVVVVEGSLQVDDRTELEVLPGHTPGGLVVYRREGPSSVAICGDVIKNAWDALNGKPSAAGVDAAAARESIGKVMEKADVLVPGHDRPFAFRHGAIQFLSPFFWQVRGHILPRPEDDIILDIDMAPALVPECVGPGRLPVGTRPI